MGISFMDERLVEHIRKGERDSTGAEIETIYGSVSHIYAVYGTNERVMVQFADSDQMVDGEMLGSQQRKALAYLNPIRGEINGMLDGWRKSSYINQTSKRARAKHFDRRTADALTVALQGDPDRHALDLLKSVNAEILNERTSTGRVEYLFAAAFCALVLFILVGWLSAGPGTTANPSPVSDFMAANSIWLATSLGSLGALFSIALAIKGRSIRPDLLRSENMIDAVLRILIGAVSAVILFSLFKGNLVALTLGGTPILLDSDTPSATHLAIIVAFLAGFSERMVGDFLGSAVLAGVGAGPAAADTPVVQQADQAPKLANEMNPLGIVTGDTPAGDAHLKLDGAEAESHDDAHVDGCLCDLSIADSELTDDSELPEATGGIEKAA